MPARYPPLHPPGGDVVVETLARPRVDPNLEEVRVEGSVVVRYVEATAVVAEHTPDGAAPSALWPRGRRYIYELWRLVPRHFQYSVIVRFYFPLGSISPVAIASRAVQHRESDFCGRRIAEDIEHVQQPHAVQTVTDVLHDNYRRTLPCLGLNILSGEFQSRPGEALHRPLAVERLREGRFFPGHIVPVILVVGLDDRQLLPEMTAPEPRRILVAVQSDLP
mmetsp:Transcript_24687/g.72239  ORF Transcript_24687/g.72239 Transcript_24687/m.72239 type:complete len:221 (-) Transcript_24687:1125-1787(-)